MCAELLDCNASLPDSLVQIMAWVLGEYSYLITVEEGDEVGYLPQEGIAEQLCTMARERKFKDPATRGCIVTALLKLSAQSGTVPAIVADCIEHFSRSRDADLQQRCLEFQALVQRGDIMGSCLPMDARLGLPFIHCSLIMFHFKCVLLLTQSCGLACQCSCEDLELDEPLSFLSEISDQAIEKGAPLYCAPLDLDDTLPAHGEGTGSLKFAHYSVPGSSSHSVPAALDGPIPDLAEAIQLSVDSVGNSSPGGAVDVMQHNNPMEILKLKAKGSTKVWGAGGTVETDWSKTKPCTSSANAPPPPSLPTVADFTATATGKQPTADLSAAEMKSKQKTPEELKKERMAAALFGGIGNYQTNGGGVTRRRQSQWGRVGDASKMSSTASGEPGRAVSQDLLDMSFDMPGGGMEERGVNVKDKSGACSSNSPPLHDTVQSMSHSVATESNLFEGMTVKSAAVEELSTSVESIHVSPCADDTRRDTSSPDLFDVEDIQSHDSVHVSVPVEETGEYTTPKGSDLGRSQDLSAIFSKDLMSSTTATTLPERGGSTEGWHMTSTAIFSWGGHNMKPLLIATHEFGEDWTGSNMTERTLIGLKCSGQHKLKTPEDAMQVLASHGLHPVESIPSTSEGICAGTCKDTRVLVHFKLQPQSAAIDLTVHCQDIDIIDAFMLCLKQNIESSNMNSNTY